jgi:lysozyme
MKFINENAWKYLSVKLPILGAFLMLVLIPALQWAVDFKIIPVEYHAYVTGGLMVVLSYIGKKLYQPSLHQIKSFAAVPSTDDNLKNLFSNFRKILGGSLTQAQVSKINDLLAGFKGEKSVSQNGINLLSSFEGCELAAYLCPAKVWTIGFGTTVYPSGVKVKKGDACTLEQAKKFKANDLKRFEKTVNDLVKVSLTQNQFDALVSLAYNIGTGAFEKSTLLKKLNAGDYQGAADQFTVWNKGGGKVLQGLVNRRAKERELFLK